MWQREREHRLDYVYISMAMEEMEPSTNFTPEQQQLRVVKGGMTVTTATLLQ